LYFAYGSNMRRSRLENRVGRVVVRGCSALSEYRHAFAKRGDDGTAKGTLVAAVGGLVHGVLYDLSGAQLATLARHEGGYRRIDVSVAGAAAITFEALRLVTGLKPNPEYVEHYMVGMAEHGMPVDYVELIRLQSMQ